MAQGQLAGGAAGARPAGRSLPRGAWLERVFPVAWPPAAALIGLIALWEIAERVFLIPEYLLPRPSHIAEFMAQNSGLLARHGLATLETTLAGFALAVVFGVALAVLIVWSTPFERAVYPLLVLTQVIPKVAVAPLIVVYMGFGLEPKIFLAFLVSFFPMVINTALGLRSVDPELLQLLMTLRASRWQILRKVRWYRALPNVFEGAKIAVTLAIIGAIVGEFSAGNLGLGYLVASSASSVNTTLSFASLFALIVIGIVLFEAVHLVGVLTTPWLRRQPEAERPIERAA